MQPTTGTRQASKMYKYEMEEAQCIKCKKMKPISDFYPSYLKDSRYIYKVCSNNIKKLQMEIKKYEVLYANCYREEHYKLDQIEKEKHAEI